MSDTIHQYQAINEPNQPYCVCGDKEDGFSVELYESENGGKIVGGVIYRKENNEIIKTFGWIPAELLEKKQ